MNKIIIGDHEIFLLEKPLKQLTKVYGLSIHLVTLLELRFELFSHTILPLTKIAIFIEQINKVFPVNLGFKPLYLYYLYFLEYACNYKTYRHLYNLPVRGQRTWGGGRSLRILKSALYNYKLRKFNKFYKWGTTTFLAEITNLLWYQQWRHEWLISYTYQNHLPWYVRKKKKMNLNCSHGW